MNDAQLLERLAWADEFPATKPLPDDIWSVDAISLEVERRTGMTQTTDHKAPKTDGPSGRTRGALVAASAFALVILLGVVIWATTSGESGGEVVDAPPTTAVVPTTEAAAPTTSPAPTDPETVAADSAFIGRFVDTWFESADPLTAMAMIGGEAYTDLYAAEIRAEGDQAHISEITYQAAIDADVAVSDCVPLDRPRVYQCSVSYSNMLFTAADAPPSVTEREFEVISDALIAPMIEAYPGDNWVTTAWLRFEEEMGLAAESSCRAYGSHSVSCPALQREHLDAFGAWIASQ